MNAQFAEATPFDEQRYLEEQSLKNKRFGLFLWRIANAFAFLFFIFMNYIMRSSQNSWPPEGVSRVDWVLPTIFSVVLLLSAIPAIRAQAAIRQGNTKALERNVLAVIALGLVFLVGLVIIGKQIPYSGVYSSMYLSMMGFHGLHAIAGMVLFGYVFLKAKTYSKENHWGVEAAVVFWHFVDLMWIFFFIVLYVI